MLCLAVTLAAGSVGGCTVQPGVASPTALVTGSPSNRPLATELTLYNWAEYLPQAVLEAFTAEYGVKVNYVVYDTEEQALAELRAGKAYDVVVLPNELIPTAIDEHLLAEIEYGHVPNFKNISPNFRDLAYDPGNRYSIPYNWGTSGLLVRRDLAPDRVTRWADLWDPRYAGKVAIWPIPRTMLPVALKSLGYSANSENPAELEAALQRLLSLKSQATLVPGDTPSVTPMLSSGQAIIAVGWAYDAFTGQQANSNIEYVLPQEGSLLWGDNWTIPAASSNRYTAEVFLNFVLRPEIGGQIVNSLFYASANEAARAFVDPELSHSSTIFPSNDDLKRAEIIMPLSPDGQTLYDRIWQRFMAAP